MQAARPSRRLSLFLVAPLGQRDLAVGISLDTASEVDDQIAPTRGRTGTNLRNDVIVRG
jgi:hypothetical protein